MDEQKKLVANFKQSISSVNSQISDGKSQEEVNDYNIAQLKAESFAQNIKERKKFAKWIFWMVVGWLFSIVAIVVCVGINCLKLDNSIILALIGSTTINVTTFFLVVTKYLFPGTKAET